MDHKKLNDFLDEFIVGKFLVNFVPGLILFYALTSFINISVGGDGLTAFVIVVSISWVLGVLIELIFFRKSFYNKANEVVFSRIQNIYLLFGKLGICMVIGCLICIDADWDPEDNHRDLLNILKLVFFGIVGILLYLVYWKHRKNA